MAISLDHTLLPYTRVIQNDKAEHQRWRQRKFKIFSCSEPRIFTASKEKDKETSSLGRITFLLVSFEESLNRLQLQNQYLHNISKNQISEVLRLTGRPLINKAMATTRIFSTLKINPLVKGIGEDSNILLQINCFWLLCCFP